LQEYFYKSQESLATVIDFVEEKIEGRKKEKKVADGEGNGNTWSTHSSPLMPASRRRAHITVRRFTP